MSHGSSWLPTPWLDVLFHHSPMTAEIYLRFSPWLLSELSEHPPKKRQTVNQRIQTSEICVVTLNSWDLEFSRTPEQDVSSWYSESQRKQSWVPLKCRLWAGPRSCCFPGSSQGQAPGRVNRAKEGRHRLKRPFLTATAWNTATWANLGTIPLPLNLPQKPKAFPSVLDILLLTQVHVSLKLSLTLMHFISVCRDRS